MTPAQVDRARRKRERATVHAMKERDRAIAHYDATVAARQAGDVVEYARLLHQTIRSATADRDGWIQDYCVGGQEKEREEMATALGVSLATIDRIVAMDPLR